MRVEQQPTDGELVRRAIAAQGDRQRRAAAFGAIADRHRPAVLRWCSRTLPSPEAAQDVGQETFRAAFELLAAGKPPAQPEKLAGWLINIARYRRLEYLRVNDSRGRGPLPDNQAFEDLADDDESRSGYAGRRAHALRLIDTVVATLSEPQQQVYRLRFEQELTGREMAGLLGVTEKTAGNEATTVQQLVAVGFGALVLAQDGRPYCAALARILDEAAGAGFTTALRERIIRHFDTCARCDKCRVCNEKRRQLTVPYVPVLIPILYAAEFRERIGEVIRQMTSPNPWADSSARPGSPPAGPPPRAEPDRPRRQGARHRRRARRARRRVPLIAAAAAVVIAAAAVADASVLTSGSPRPGARSTAPPTAAGAVVRVRPCGRTGPRTPATLQLPAGVSLPAGAAVFDTGVAHPPGSPDGRYIIGPASQRCTLLPAGGGTTVLAVGAQNSPPRVFTMLMPGVTAPSCTASSGNLFAAMLAKASRAQTCRSASSPALPGAVMFVLLHDNPGLSAVIAWAPHTQSSAFFAPAGGSVPTYAVFAARAAGGHTPAYAPEGISCTLPPAQVSICSAALRYFLIQAAGTSISPAALRAAVMAVQQFVARPGRPTG